MKNNQNRLKMPGARFSPQRRTLAAWFTVLAVASFATLPGIAIAGGDNPECCKRPPPPTPFDPPVAHLSGSVNGASCTGKSDLVRHAYDLSDADKAVRQTVLPPIHGAASDLYAIYQASKEFLHWLDSIGADPGAEAPWPTIEWEFACTGDIQLSANGWSSVARRVSIEIANAGGVPTEMPGACHYDGLVVTTCPQPTTYSTPAETAGVTSGSSHIMFDGERFFLEPELPRTANVCLKEDTRAANKGEFPGVDFLLIHPAYDLLDEPVCADACIDYNAKGCFAAETA